MREEEEGGREGGQDWKRSREPSRTTEARVGMVKPLRRPVGRVKPVRRLARADGVSVRSSSWRASFFIKASKAQSIRGPEGGVVMQRGGRAEESVAGVAIGCLGALVVVSASSKSNEVQGLEGDLAAAGGRRRGMLVLLLAEGGWIGKDDEEEDEDAIGEEGGNGSDGNEAKAGEVEGEGGIDDAEEVTGAEGVAMVLILMVGQEGTMSCTFVVFIFLPDSLKSKRKVREEEEEERRRGRRGRE